MLSNLTDLTIVVDRSGSMNYPADLAGEASAGINQLVRDQAEMEGSDCLVTLVEFDDKIDVVYEAVKSEMAGRYVLKPRNMTRLYDAVGQTIHMTGERLLKIAESQRPGLVIFAIVTDGGENASTEFKKDQICEMIKHQTEVYNWQFTYLGSNQDAFKEAGDMGIAMGSTANYVPDATKIVYGAVSRKVKHMRAASLAGQEVECSYTDDERESLMGREK